MIPVELTPAQEQRLKAEAHRLGLSAEDLARLAIEDLLDRPEPDFEDAARHVLQKNRELYDRLS